MKILDKNGPIVHVLHFFPQDITAYANAFKANFSNDKKFVVMFTWVAGTQEFPAIVVDVLDYIKDVDNPQSAFVDILTFNNHGLQLAVLSINSTKIDIQQIIPIINKTLDDKFTYTEWLDNPSRPSIVADSETTADYIIHMMNMLLHCNIEPRPIESYGNQENPLGT